MLERIGVSAAAKELWAIVIFLFFSGLATTALSAVLVCLSSRTADLVTGIVLLFSAAVLLLRAFLASDEFTARAVYIAVALFCVAAAPSLFSGVDEFAPTLNRAILFAFTAIALSSLLSLLFPFATARCSPTALLLHGIHDWDERLLYFIINLTMGLLNGLVVGLSGRGRKIEGFDHKGLLYSLPVWFVSAVIHASAGFGLASNFRDRTPSYDAAPPLARPESAVE
jgi:hypothetical protein